MDHDSTRLDRRQILATILICCMSLLTAMCSFSTIFTASHPNLECEEHQNVPVKVNTSFCEQILSNGSNNGSCRFNYHFGETIITEWKLVCDDRKYLSNYLQTSYMCGSLFSIIFGYFSDRNGRKKTLIVLLMLIALLKMANQFIVWSPWVNLTVTGKYAVYLVSEFFTGLFVNGITSVSYVLLYELSPARYIISMSNLNMYAYVLGELVLLVISYLSRNWHPINWFIAVYALVIAVLSVLRLPESKMYLMMNQTGKKPKEDLKLGNDENSKRLLTSDSPGAKRDVPSRIEDRSVIKYMFKSKETIVKILLISYVWFSLPLVYLGISLGITTVGKINPYLIYALSSVAELIGYLLCHLNDRFNNKLVFFMFLLVSGLMCLLVSTMQYQIMESQQNNDGSFLNQTAIDVKKVLLVVFISTGKAMSSAAYNCAFIYTAHMFPTNVRNTLMLTVSSIGRLGAILSPQINLLGELAWKLMPYFIFSLASFISSLVILYLPDSSTSREL